MTLCPVPSGKKSRKVSRKTKRSKKSAKKSTKSKKPDSHKMKLFKGRRNRHGKTIAQCIMMTLRVFSEKTHKGASFANIRKVMKAADVHVSNFVLKKVLNKMVQRKILGHAKYYYTVTGKHLPKTSVNKRKHATKRTNKSDRRFRAKLRRIASKVARGGRTYERVIFDILKAGDQNMTFNQIKAAMKKCGIKTNNWILIKVINRMREKNIMKCTKWHNHLTGKALPKPRKSKGHKFTKKSKKN